jgi:hypothetical protein
VAGGRHSALVGAEDPHDHLIVMQQLPRRTCIHVAVMLVAAPAGAGAGIPEKALGAARWSGTSDPGCCCGMDSAKFRGVLGRRLKSAAGGCWSAVRERGEYVMFVTDLKGRWQAGGKAVHCRGDQ